MDIKSIKSKKVIDLLKAFYDIYTTRDKEPIEWKKNGGKVVGCLGGDVPEELLIAAGFLPVRVRGSSKESFEIANQYLERGFDPLIRAQFEGILDGSYGYLDHLVISNSSDPVIRAYYYLRTIHQVEPKIDIPNLYFFDFLHTRFRTSALYNRVRVKELIKELEIWIGNSISYENISQAISICNENRYLLKNLRAVRSAKGSRISGAQALQIIGASILMPKQKHNQLLRTLLEHIEELPELTGVKLFITGSTHDHTEFYELVESCGTVIVGEDHDFGSRQYTGEIDTEVDPIDGIVDRYHLRYPPSSKATVSERVKNLTSQVIESGAQGVIFFIHQADDACLWDFPQQEKALKELGIPVLLFDGQSYKLSVKNKDSVRKQVTAFVEQISVKN